MKTYKSLKMYKVKTVENRWGITINTATRVGPPVGQLFEKDAQIYVISGQQSIHPINGGSSWQHVGIARLATAEEIQADSAVQAKIASEIERQAVETYGY